nr:hypothetical protein [uncultured Pedobacter sp.]
MGVGNNNIKNNHPISWMQTLVAGFLSIGMHAFLLKIASFFQIHAESGGLLKLLVLQLKKGGAYFNVEVKSVVTYLVPPTVWIWLLFHFLTGFLMVILYRLFLKGHLSKNVIVEGFLFSLFPWIINSFVVLPLLNQGLFGYQAIPFSGVLYFFLANTLFGVVFVLLNSKLNFKH